MIAEPPPPPRGRQLARSTVLNVLGQALPLVIGLVAIPIAVRALGNVRFGLLGLIWAILGFVPALDLGLGRAAIKFIAESLGSGDRTRVSVLATLSAVIQTGLGAAAGLVLVVAAPLLIDRFLTVPEAFRPEARAAFVPLAAAMPFVALSGSLRAILEAAQRFDIVNLIRTPASAAMFVVPALAAPLGATLPVIVVLLLATRVATCAALGWAVPRVIPGFRWQLGSGRTLVRPLLTYGGWVAVSNAVNPLLAYAERFVLASLAGVAAAAYYTAPYEAVTRLLLVPAALAGVLFPAVSARAASPAARATVDELLVRSVRYLLFALAPVVALLVALAAPILHVWLGAEYAARSAPAFGILAGGVLVNGLAFVPTAYLLGQGRPDIPAKFHLLEVPFYIVAAWLLVGGLGVTGAALAWTLRVAVDAALLYAAMWRVSGVAPWRLLGSRGGWAALAVLMLLAIAIAVAVIALQAVVAGLALSVTLGTAFAIGVWLFVLDQAERTEIRRALL